MTTPNERVMDEWNSVTECCVCFDTFRDPRTLPCIHIFCLKCLQHLARHKLPGDRVPCPLCNQKFTIPAYGIAAFPGNPLVSRMLEIGSNARAQGSNGQEGQESSDRRELRRNAEIASRLETDMIKCLQVRAKVISNVLDKHETLKEAIIKKIEDLNFLLDDLTNQKEMKMATLKEERFELDGHLANLASYKHYCLELAQKGTAPEVTRSLDMLDKRRQELEEYHEPRICREFDIQQKLLDQMVLDSVLSCRLLNMPAGNGQDSSDDNLLNRRYSTDGTAGPDRKRARYDVSDAGGNQNLPFDGQVMGDLDSPLRNQICNDINTNSSCSASGYLPARSNSSHTSHRASDPLSNIRFGVDEPGSFTYFSPTSNNYANDDEDDDFYETSTSWDSCPDSDTSTSAEEGVLSADITSSGSNSDYDPNSSFNEDISS